MPGWPSVRRTADRELAEALRRADPAAPAALYDSYGERLHDYAHFLCGASDLAADLVHDALVTAQGCAARLRDPRRFRAWLYALTRSQVRARTSRRPSTRPGGPAGTLPLPDLGRQDDPELAGLVREVLGELGRSAREVLELSLRHGLTPQEAGAVLGLTARQAAARLSRARDHLENSAAAVVLARTGRAHCPDLSALLDSWEGPLSPGLRRRVSGHVGGCEVCAGRRPREVSAARLLDLVRVAYPPISLRRRVIGACGRPELDRTRVLITGRGDDLGRSGFPVPADRRRRRPPALAPLLLAGAALLTGTGAIVVYNESGTAGATGTSGGADSAALRPLPSPGLAGSPGTSAFPNPFGLPGSPDTSGLPGSPDEGNPTGEPVIGEEPPGTSPSPAPSARTRPAAPRRSPAATPSRRGAEPAATPTRRGAGGRLRITCPGTVIGGEAEIGLTARGAALSWTATASRGVRVRPARGSVKAGGAAGVRVTVSDPGVTGSARVVFTSNGGTTTCALSWDGDDDEPPPARLPTREPAAPEEPEEPEDRAGTPSRRAARDDESQLPDE
ncbi:sigma-70 family RNA polymerase sigma factor [Nonomuraea candida]|uniref:sigma-70 family RNA polymerase sigma factor n=1 Tax=Nonomuraea candida TaxID=359159 RepID=UPI0005BDC384|nr:sigma-70 family RNA polymerase sigma factor [Nonomuraea candida]